MGVTLFDRDYDLFQFMQAVLALIIVVAFVAGIILNVESVSELRDIVLLVVGFFFGKATASSSFVSQRAKS